MLTLNGSQTEAKIVTVIYFISVKEANMTEPHRVTDEYSSTRQNHYRRFLLFDPHGILLPGRGANPRKRRPQRRTAGPYRHKTCRRPDTFRRRRKRRGTGKPSRNF